MGANNSSALPALPGSSDSDRCWKCDLEWVERREKVPGTRPGSSVEKLIRVGSPIAASFQNDVLSNDLAIVYAVHFEEATQRHFLIVVEIDDKKELWEHSFLDRGIRKLLREGSSVFFVPLSAVEEAKLGQPLKDGRIAMNVIYNTGRCGSTLMHKMLYASGVASFSEPHWCDQLANMAKKKGADVTALLKACWFLDISLSRRNIFKDAKIFSLNPKAFGQTLIKHALDIEAAVPTRYMFMYRAAPKVVESFGSIFSSRLSPFETLTLNAVSWTSFGIHAAMKAPFRGALEEKKDLVREGLPSHPIAAMLTRMWIEAVQGFLDAQEDFADSELAKGKALVLRMDEYVTKDLVKREETVKGVLRHVGIKASKDTLASALAVFNVHSQKGSNMSTTQRKKFLDPRDEQKIADCARNAIVSEYIVHEKDGNFFIDAPLASA